MNNPGLLLHDGKYFYAAYNKEQRPEFEAKGKILVHVFKDHLLQEPVLDYDGNQKRVLKSVDLVRVKGYLD